MSVIACDSIGPKHGTSVHINGVGVSSPTWYTTTATATIGPFAAQTTVTATLQWSVDATNIVTVQFPSITVVGLSPMPEPPAAHFKFASVAALPAPYNTTQVIGVGYRSSDPAAAIETQTRIHVDKSVTVMFAGEAIGDGTSYVLEPVVLRYMANPHGDWSATADATAPSGPTISPGTATWMMYYCTAGNNVYVSMPWGRTWVGDGTNTITFSPFIGLPPPLYRYANWYDVMMTDLTVNLVELRLNTDSSLTLIKDVGEFTDGQVYSMNEVVRNFNVTTT